MATLCYSGANGLQNTPPPMLPQLCLDHPSNKRKRCSSHNINLRITQAPRKHICQDCEKRSQQVQRKSKSKLKKLKVDRGHCIEPPVILEVDLQTRDRRRTLHSPHIFVSAEFLRVNDDGSMTPMPCIGTMVSSLHPIKVPKTTEKRGYFVFSDMIPQFEENLPGRYIFRFSLMDMRLDERCGFYACKILDVLSPSFEVEFHPKVPSTLESTQLTRVLREGGVNLKLKKTPKPRGNKSKTIWSIHGPMDPVPRNVSVMGPQYGLSNGLTDGAGVNSINIRDRIKVSTWSLPMPTTSVPQLASQQTMSHQQYHPAMTATSSMGYPQSSASILPPAYHTAGHSQHFGHLPPPTPYSTSGAMPTDGFWTSAKANNQFPHVPVTTSYGLPTSDNGPYLDMTATAGYGSSANANGQYADAMSAAAYGPPTHGNGQYAEAMPAAGYGTTVNASGQYSDLLWPGYLQPRAEQQDQEYFGADAGQWKQ